jgi:phage/plasmid-like protein (TIGR03299 family)
MARAVTEANLEKDGHQMAHNIYNDGTKDCMFVVGTREDAWHLLGQRCDKAATWEQAVELAGLNWKVFKQRNYARQPQTGKVVETDSYTIFRDSDNAQLGTVGPEYTVKQNRECFQFIDTLMEANGGAHYDSAGALGNGARIWCAVRVPKADIAIGGDKHESYLVFTTAHDGSMAHIAKLTTVRVVCQNTLNSALSSEGSMFRVKHTAAADVRLNRAKELMTGITVDAKTLESKLAQLAQRKMTRESMVTVLNRLFPAPKEENASTTRRENVLTDVLNLYAANDNGAFPEIAGSAYNLLNAVTEYTDHYRSARITDSRQGWTQQQARAENAVNGTGDRLKASALAVIDDVTEQSQSEHVPFDSPIISPMDDAQFLKALGIRL